MIRTGGPDASARRRGARAVLEVVAMPSIVGVHHTSFTVADLQRSLEFFRDRLGLEVVYAREIREDYFSAIVGLPGCVVRAALLRIPGSGHHVELFQYLAPIGQGCQPRPCDPG